MATEPCMRWVKRWGFSGPARIATPAGTRTRWRSSQKRWASLSTARIGTSATTTKPKSRPRGAAPPRLAKIVTTSRSSTPTAGCCEALGVRVQRGSQHQDRSRSMHRLRREALGLGPREDRNSRRHPRRAGRRRSVRPREDCNEQYQYRIPAERAGSAGPPCSARIATTRTLQPRRSTPRQRRAFALVENRNKGTHDDFHVGVVQQRRAFALGEDRNDVTSNRPTGQHGEPPRRSGPARTQAQQGSAGCPYSVDATTLSSRGTSMTSRQRWASVPSVDRSENTEIEADIPLEPWVFEPGKDRNIRSASVAPSSPAAAPVEDRNIGSSP
ncbi:hypothetical protein C8D87_11330 [Lentzea atacamensis]|uniref:Uncharacterized protein n=1 Tax=Lentzea atacamensis TaxID=531938 RepID=A0ABX9DYN0_9PSEU|nr:hypothetical protein C8D87_11330 [Lentzea atacamensis]